MAPLLHTSSDFLHLHLHLHRRLLFFAVVSVFVTVCAAQSGDFSSDNDHKPMTTYACQYSILELACPDHHVIRITRATYGRFSRWQCNPQGIINGLNLQCFSVGAVEVISSKCDGHTSCFVPINEQTFGDPCPGTSKYVEVQHYCEPAKIDHQDGGSSGLKPLPDGNRPRLSTVPVPENVRVCEHPMAMKSVYDLYWEMPETPEKILHFNIEYQVNRETRHRDVMRAIPLDGNKYMFAFKPDDDQRGVDHRFAVKAYALNIGWGDYSALTASRRCHFDEDLGYVTLDPDEGNLTPTATTPKSGGGLRQMCSPVTELGVEWPETGPNEVRTAVCPEFLGGHGVMRYKCLHDGVWDRNGPETDKCYEPEDISTRKPTTTATTTTTTTTTTTSTTSTSTTSTIPPSTTPNKDIPAPVRYNAEVSSSLQKLDVPGSAPKEKYNLTTFLPSATQRLTLEIENTQDPKEKKALADDMKMTMLELSEDLMNDEGAWSNMSANQQRHTAASVLHSVERSGLLAASTMPVGTTNTSRKPSVVMKVMNVDASLGQPAILDDKSGSGSRSKVNKFTIPPDVLRQAAGYQGDSVPVVFVIMSDISEWMTPKTEPADVPVSNDDNVIDARPPTEPPRRLVNTDVVSVSVSKHSMKNLVSPVGFLLEHRQTESVENPQCSFWDTELGGWSREGCEVVESNKTHTVCRCNHLTSFAVLMDITGAIAEIPASVRFSLELITYIGCSISIICLLLSWVTFTCFKNLDCDRNTIHKHLVFCLMIAQIVLVIGVGQTEPPLLCSIIAGVLHFFFLASFAWMCLEGVQLYVMLIEVFESEHSRVLYYYLFGYGGPAIIVSVSAAVFSGGYGTETHCWLTVERGFIWSFVGPACAVLLVNVVMLGIAISIMVRHSSMSHTMRQKTVPQKMRSWVKGAAVLVVLLGLTWVFGVLYLDNVYNTLIFSYIFTVLNSLQGLFIFLFHCLFNEKVQKEYRRLVRQCNWLPVCLRSRYGYTSSSGSRENSSSGNVMARLFRGKRRHSGCGDSSSNSAKPFLHKEQRHLSSSGPSSSDGVTSSRLSSETCNNNSRKLSHQSSSSSYPHHSPAPHANTRLLHAAEVGGIAGELSEILDCSVVDSEFVSEYCQQNLQVGQETKRYSTSSEDSGGGEELDSGSNRDDVEESLDRLAALSVDSLAKRESHLISTSDLGEGEREEEEEGGGVGEEGEKRKSEGRGGRGEEEEEEEEEGKPATTTITTAAIATTTKDAPASLRVENEVDDDDDDDDDDDEDADDDNDEEKKKRKGSSPAKTKKDDDDIHLLHHHHRGGIPACSCQESQPLMMRQTSDSERVLILNAANKPRDVNAGPGGSRLSPKQQSPSLTHLPITSSSTSSSSSQAADGAMGMGADIAHPPVHNSVPCLKFLPGTTGTTTATATIPSTITYLPPTDLAKDSAAAAAVAEKEGVMNSLPDLSANTHSSCNGTTPQNPSLHHHHHHHQDLVPGESPTAVKRYSSDGRMQFSPYRFSGSEC